MILVGSRVIWRSDFEGYEGIPLPGIVTKVVNLTHANMVVFMTEADLEIFPGSILTKVNVKLGFGNGEFSII